MRKGDGDVENGNFDGFYVCVKNILANKVISGIFNQEHSFCFLLPNEDADVELEASTVHDCEVRGSPNLLDDFLSEPCTSVISSQSIEYMLKYFT